MIQIQFDSCEFSPLHIQSEIKIQLRLNTLTHYTNISYVRFGEGNRTHFFCPVVRLLTPLGPKKTENSSWQGSGTIKTTETTSRSPDTSHSVRICVSDDESFDPGPFCLSHHCLFSTLSDTIFTTCKNIKLEFPETLSNSVDYIWNDSVTIRVSLAKIKVYMQANVMWSKKL